MGKSWNAQYSCVTNAPMVVVTLFGVFLAHQHLRRETATMGELIEGPWMRRDVSQLMSRLDHELRRMTIELEQAREDYTRETAHAGQSHAPQETDLAGELSVQPRFGAES
jgi:phage FluMu protein gp41